MHNQYFVSFYCQTATTKSKQVILFRGQYFYGVLCCREHPQIIALFLIKAMKRVNANRDHENDFWHVTKPFSTRNNTYQTGDIARRIFSIFRQHQYSTAPPLIASHSLEKGLTSIVALEIIDGITKSFSTFMLMENQN